MTKGKRGEKPRVIVKKAKGRHGGHHGGAWKVAYADFVTAMMALFIVLWIVSATDEKIRVGLAQYFRDPGIFQSAPGILPDNTGGVAPEAGKTHPLEELQGRLTKELLGPEELSTVQDQILIKMVQEGLLIELMDSGKETFFDLASAQLKPMLVRVLEKIAAQLKEKPHRLVIAGHTDSLPFHHRTFYSNWELSAARALNTRRALESMGIDPKRIERVSGHADQQPLLPDDPRHPANRRISILILRDPSASAPAGLSR
jgi:chemotaxis protein MotB